MSALAPRQGLRALLARLRGRPDSEHEMSFNRMTNAVVALALVLVAGLDRHIIYVLLAFVALSIVVFCQLLLDDRAQATRRGGMIVADMAMICFYMGASGALGAGFWPLLLWTILGNGFRFGRLYLFAATGVAVAGFACVIAYSPFWRANVPLSIGLMLGLVAVPLYSAKLIRKLSSATEAAEQASRAKSYFLASVSHELRTPLTAIIGLGAHLHSQENDAEKRQMVDTITSAGRSLLGMINRLLDYSRSEARGGDYEPAPFDLVKLLVGVRELMRFQTAEKGLAINVHLAADTPRALLGNETHLRDILVNLVGNAIKFTEAGAITIVGGAERDPAGLLMLRLTVADTGMGIAPEAQEHIFGSFRQADDTIIDRFGGTGLGLAICKQLAEAMGGRIGVDSAPGEGSRFWFTARVDVDAQAPLPTAPEARLLLFSDDPALAESIGRGIVRRASRAEIRELYEAGRASIVLTDASTMLAQDLTPPDLAESLQRGAVAVLLTDPASLTVEREWVERGFATSVSRDADNATLDRAIALACALAGDAAGPIREVLPLPARARRRVLVADDNQMNQKVFSMILGRVGHEIVTAPDGEAALDLMKDHGFDIVLMDINMPVLNGIEATKLYRFAALGQPRVPIVGVTADASPENVERCLEAGMDACVNKPIDAEALLALIEQLTEAHAAPPPEVPAFDPAGVVTPLFRAADPAPTGAIDWSSLAELEELGGHDFVVDLLQVYAADSAQALAAVEASVAAGDVAAFRSNTHALRSSAANVGATRVAELCLHLQRIGEPEFHARGPRHATELGRELGRVADALAERPEWRQTASA